MLRDLCRRRGGKIVRGSGSGTLQESSMFETQHHGYTCKLKTETLTKCTGHAQVQGMPSTSTEWEMDTGWTASQPLLLDKVPAFLTLPITIFQHPFTFLLVILAICYGSFFIPFSLGKFL